MRTEITRIYTYRELSEEAKEKAIENYRNQYNGDFMPFLDDATETLKKFCNLFEIEYTTIDYLETGRSKYHTTVSDEIKELSGSRLVSYLWNNFKNDLFTGKYYRLPSGNKITHNRVKSTKCPSGYFNAYHSAIQLAHCCELTGVCYDEDILEPVYKTLNYKDFNTTYEGMITECIENLCQSVQKEAEWRDSDEYIKDEMQANGVEFTRNGSIH